MNTLIDNLIAGLNDDDHTPYGPLVEYDTARLPVTYSGLADVLVELDPEASNTFPSDEMFRILPREKQEDLLRDLVTVIDERVDEYSGNTAWFGVEMIDGKHYFGVWPG